MRRLGWFVGWILLSISTGMATSPTGWALEKSADRQGIDARTLQKPPYNLTGKDVFIGQVELSRPSRFAVDKISNKLLQIDRAIVQPYEVFFRDRQAIPNKNLDDHSAQVAAVIISQDKIRRGIAPNAKLLSSAYSQRRQDGQPEACIASQHIARQYNGTVRAINFSFGELLSEDPRPNAKLDGDALLTLCVDWIATTYNTLPIVAGNQGKGGIPIPTDLYNGFTVGFTREVDGIYRQLDRGNLIDEPFIDRNNNGKYDRGEVFSDLNKDGKWTAGVESPVDGRRSLALLAPGNNLKLPTLQSKFKNANGSSFAAPHVVGTIALLHEYANRQIESGEWSIDARRHEAIKAVLINSADKIQDAGDGKILGMSKTILDAFGKTWIDTEAYANRSIPLSINLGAGQLNAYRAFLQYKGGQQSPVNGTGNISATVKAIGWDTNIVEVDKYQDYIFANPLEADSFISATLTWDRQVKLNDKNGNGLFDIGESFTDEGFNRIELYLMRSQDTDISQSVWSSISQIDNLQHIFMKIPATGKYKLRVVFKSPQVSSPSQRYGLAWWAKSL
ncbi:MAG: peptidase S8 and S53 subtilisin kexin sedolisin [Pseudanabaena frigida]|uniref:Peptidase S8 and S53 subtilisin kexin sedolisin n=1 Tax=Pseudanabaena frigida TaxID=945775 RepID=A0A2W4YAP2_9CYAN|nr:MAG: peptidase S8 and S53 subtilisin kexin sedolisin [Pseudanabaena frigida]